MRKRKLSPAKVQTLIWAGAAAVCAIFAVTVYTVSGRAPAVVSDTELPEPTPARVAEEPELSAGVSDEPGPDEVYPAESPEGAAGDRPGNPAASVIEGPEPPPLIPDGVPPPSEARTEADRPRKPVRRQELTEDLFVQLSALMFLAGESFTDSEVGMKSLRKACDDILEQQGVAREDFERMADEVAGDPERRAKIRDRVFERVDELRAPRRVRMGARATPRVDPKRKPRAAIPSR